MAERWRLLYVLCETISARGVGGQTKCSGTPPSLLWIWPQNISVNAVRQMSLASERCLPRAEWHFLGTIWDCSDIENTSRHTAAPCPLSSPPSLQPSLYFAHPPSLPPSANFPRPECCSLLPFHSVTGQKIWQSSKSLVAQHRGAKWMKMWVGSTKGKWLQTGKTHSAAYTLRKAARRHKDPSSERRVKIKEDRRTTWDAEHVWRLVCGDLRLLSFSPLCRITRLSLNNMLISARHAFIWIENRLHLLFGTKGHIENNQYTYLSVLLDVPWLYIITMHLERHSASCTSASPHVFTV